jgi:hypothetical protein
MEKEVILQELENICEKLGVKLRYENGDFVGGLCRISEEKFIIVNKKLAIDKKIMLIAKEISILNFEEIFILPAIKEIIIENSNLDVSDIKIV